MMETAPTSESVLPHLERALASPSIPARAHIAGRQLLERMTSPVRVVVTGHPGSGKSQLLNLLAGERVIPDGSRLPSVELTHGLDRKLTVQLADGESKVMGRGASTDVIEASAKAYVDGLNRLASLGPR